MGALGKTATWIGLAAAAASGLACQSSDGSQPEPSPEPWLTGTVRDFESREPLDGVLVRAIDGLTGVELGVEETSEVVERRHGIVRFTGEAISRELGLWCVGDRQRRPEYKDSYHFNVPSETRDLDLSMVERNFFNIVPLVVGLAPEWPEATVMGAVVQPLVGDWVDPVPCATVRIFSAVTQQELCGVRYHSDAGVPTTLEIQPWTNPRNGYYYAAEVPAGQIVARAYRGDVEIGSASFMAFEDAVSFSPILVEPGELPACGGDADSDIDGDADADTEPDAEPESESDAEPAAEDGADLEEALGPCEPGTLMECGTDVGLCAKGVRTCFDEGTWGPCAGAEGPWAEICDGRDNDCDGLIDEAGVCDPEPDGAADGSD